MKTRRRTQKRAEKRAKLKEAARLRRDRDRCLHGDDVRVFATEEACDADDSPPVICEICGKQKLAVGLVGPEFSDPDAVIAAAGKFENILVR